MIKKGRGILLTAFLFGEYLKKIRLIFLIFPVSAVLLTGTLGCSGDATARQDTLERIKTLRIDPILTMPAHRGYVFYARFSPDGKWLASGGADATIRLWKTGEWTNVRTITENYREVWGIPLSFSPDSRYLAGGAYEVLKLYKAGDQFREIAAQSAHPRGIQTVSFDREGRTLVSGGVDGMIRVWTVPELRFLSEIRAHASEVWSICFSPDGTLLVSGGEDNTVRIWKYPGFELQQEIRFHTRPIEYVRVSQDGRYLLAASADGSVSVWKWGDFGRPYRVLKGHMGAVLVVEYNPLFSLIFTGGDDDSIYVFSADTGETVYQLKEHFGDVMTLAFSPDGRILASGSRDRTLKIWSVTN